MHCYNIVINYWYQILNTQFMASEKKVPSETSYGTTVQSPCTESYFSIPSTSYSMQSKRRRSRRRSLMNLDQDDPLKESGALSFFPNFEVHKLNVNDSTTDIVRKLVQAKAKPDFTKIRRVNFKLNEIKKLPTLLEVSDEEAEDKTMLRIPRVTSHSTNDAN